MQEARDLRSQLEGKEPETAQSVAQMARRTSPRCQAAILPALGCVRWGAWGDPPGEEQRLRVRAASPAGRRGAEVAQLLLLGEVSSEGQAPSRRGAWGYVRGQPGRRSPVRCGAGPRSAPAAGARAARALRRAEGSLELGELRSLGLLSVPRGREVCSAAKPVERGQDQNWNCAKKIGREPD